MDRRPENRLLKKRRRELGIRANYATKRPSQVHEGLERKDGALRDDETVFIESRDLVGIFSFQQRRLR